MSSFKFNFSSEHDSKNEKSSKEDYSAEKSKSEEIKWLESEEIIFNKERSAEFDKIIDKASVYKCVDVDISYVKTPISLSKPIDLHSDLNTAVYEGGFKVWECTHDLITYLQKNVGNMQDKKVLDLGCGAGFLGIYSLMSEAQEVVFQDYNKEVIELVTMPNVVLNFNKNDDINYILDKCKFYSGDWASFNEKLKSNIKFDYIFTSETIYNIDNYVKLLNLFKHCLKACGIALVAAKSCYFGVGGSTKLFEEAVLGDGTFKFEKIWNNNIGIKREIIKISRY